MEHTAGRGASHTDCVDADELMTRWLSRKQRESSAWQQAHEDAAASDRSLVRIVPPSTEAQAQPGRTTQHRLNLSAAQRFIRATSQRTSCAPRTTARTTPPTREQPHETQCHASRLRIIARTMDIRNSRRVGGGGLLRRAPRVVGRSRNEGLAG